MRDADIHLLITRQQTGGGGQQYEIRLLGRKSFKGENDTLRYNTLQSDTEDQRRRGLVKYVTVGLMPYLSDFTDLTNFDIVYLKPIDEIQQQPEDDPWNNWIVELGGSTFLSGEATQSRIFLAADVWARRITEEWKVSIFARRTANRRTFEREDGDETFIVETQSVQGRIVKSLGPHWSTGIVGRSRIDTRDNLDFTLSGAPAVEYSIFPYSEFQEREIILQYSIAPSYNNYTDTTIFSRVDEVFYQQRFEANANFTQPWGEIESRIEVSNFLNDFSKNRAVFDMEIDLRISRGLALSIDGRYSIINDQIFLAKGDVSDEEQLLNLRQQATSFFFRTSIGIEFTFGSMFNNVVNPRL